MLWHVMFVYCVAVNITNAELVFKLYIYCYVWLHILLFMTNNYDLAPSFLIMVIIVGSIEIFGIHFRHIFFLESKVSYYE